MSLRVCFIDDDAEFEIPLFHEVFDGEFDVLSGTGLNNVSEQMNARNEWQPDLFVLDMYFPIGAPDGNAIRKLAASGLELPPDGGQLREAFQNYVAAEDRFRSVLSAWKQHARGGQDLARQVARAFPETPVVFYSRKAVLQDAVRCLELKNVVKVVLKPSGEDDENTKFVTREEAGRIAAEFKEAVSLMSSPELVRVKGTLRSVVNVLRDFFIEK